MRYAIKNAIRRLYCVKNGHTFIPWVGVYHINFLNGKVIQDAWCKCCGEHRVIESDKPVEVINRTKEGQK